MPKARKERKRRLPGDQPLPEHLFTLPEYDMAQGKFIYTAIDEVRDRMFPLLGKIPKVQVEHLQHTRVTVESGEVVESGPIIQEIPFAIDLKGAISGDQTTFIDSIASAAQQKGAGEMKSFEAYFARVTEAAGTSLNAKGKPLNRQTLLETMAIRDIEFDDNGYPGLPSEIRHLFHDPDQTCTCFTDGRFEEYYLHASPRVKAWLAQLPPPCSEELRAFETLMEKKRSEFNDRKRHRQLSR
jgi:hypothetical protein